MNKHFHYIEVIHIFKYYSSIEQQQMTHTAERKLKLFFYWTECKRIHMSGKLNKKKKENECLLIVIYSIFLFKV
jgi:hypothetical protein